MDDFEYEDYISSTYADDLDALRELENEVSVEDVYCKPKRRLTYRLGHEAQKETVDVVHEVEKEIDDVVQQEEEITTEPETKKRNSETEINGSDIKRLKLDPLDDLDHGNKKDEQNELILESCQSFTKKVLDSITEAVVTKEALLKNTTVDAQPRIWKRIPPGNFLPVTSESGQRVYLRIRSEVSVDDQIKEVTQNYRLNTLHLLGIPYRQLKHDAEIEREKMRFAASSNAPEPDMENLVDENSENQPPRELWVERFKPKKYRDLLSDDGINRVLLHWLKLWDKPVFGHTSIRKTKKENQPNKSNLQKNNKFKNNFLEICDDLDPDGYPLKRIALLSGPPGLGKTTLAYILAKHAGYNPIEMNASDDRSVDVFRTQIEASTQMRAVFGEAPKPNCLIIDEIDGAPAESVNLLVSMALGKSSASTGKKRGKTKKNEIKPLLRPIICICNDKYVPALHSLRQNALVIGFPPTLSSRLATRLQEILKKFEFKADLTALLTLCEKADNDIRSCLSTLQFIHSRQRQLRFNDVHSLSIGQKDVQKSLFSIWEDIFHKPKLKRKSFIYHRDRDEESLEPMPDLNNLKDFQMKDNTTVSSRFYNILNIVQSCGEYEKLFQGMFENYLNAKISDSYLDAVTSGLEWLEFTDILNQEVLKSQNYSLYAYMPFCCVVFHLYFASATFLRITYPSFQFEFRNKCNSANNVITTLRSEMAPIVRAFATPDTIIQDILPYLLTIIHPTLRPVNTQLYSQSEKAELQHLIEVMIAYNLSYLQQLNQDGQYDYVLEPNIDLVARLPGVKNVTPFTYASKQLIAHEIEREKMRRSEANSAERAASMQATDSAKISKKNSEPKENDNKARPAMETKMKKGFEDKVAMDFFGRPITAAEIQKKIAKKPVDELGRNDIWFHFKEGYSNAVRHTIRIHDFM